MMNKVKSARVHLVRFLLLLPVVAIILLAFRNVTKHRQLPPAKAVVSDTIPGKKIPDNVRSFHTVNNRVTVTLKDGKMETYNLDNDDELAAFEKKYGKLPEPPTPPIPPMTDVVEVPAAPHPYPHTIPLPGTAPHPAHAPVADIVEVPATPYQDDCYNDKGYCISVINTPKGRMVLVASKNKKEVELVYLEDWQKDKKYEQKFGKLPPAPPDAPPPPHHPPTPIEHMPEGVSEIRVRDFDAVVTKADGKVERYDLRLAEDKAAYHKKYVGKPPYQHAAPINEITPLEKAPAQTAEVVMETPTQIKEFFPGEREVIAIIKNNMSAEDIDKLKIDLKVKGYALTLSDLKHENGKIVLIDGKLKHDGHTGHFRTDDFDTIIISRENKMKGQFMVEIRVGKNKEEQ